MKRQQESLHTSKPNVLHLSTSRFRRIARAAVNQRTSRRKRRNPSFARRPFSRSARRRRKPLPRTRARNESLIAFYLSSSVVVFLFSLLSFVLFVERRRSKFARDIHSYIIPTLCFFLSRMSVAQLSSSHVLRVCVRVCAISKSASRDLL